MGEKSCGICFFGVHGKHICRGGKDMMDKCLKEDHSQFQPHKDSE